MYDAGGKLLNGIKSMYINSLACIRLTGCETRLCHVPLTLQCVYGCSDERNENGDEEEGRE